MHEYAVVDLAGSPVLINRSKDGTLEITEDLIFHGGVGATLEMRLFSQKDLTRRLCQAGFQELIFQTEPVPCFGIAFQAAWSLPLVARKARFLYDSSAMAQFAPAYRTRIKGLSDAQAELAAWM